MSLVNSNYCLAQNEKMVWKHVGIEPISKKLDHKSNFLEVSFNNKI